MTTGEAIYGKRYARRITAMHAAGHDAASIADHLTGMGLHVSVGQPWTAELVDAAFPVAVPSIPGPRIRRPRNPRPRATEAPCPVCGWIDWDPKGRCRTCRLAGVGEPDAKAKQAEYFKAYYARNKEVLLARMKTRARAKKEPSK